MSDIEVQAQVAESLITQSSTRDDALRNAIRATELYMCAAKLADSPSEKARFRIKCKSLLIKAEKIKGLVDWPPSTQESSSAYLKPPVSTRKLDQREKNILAEGSRINGFFFPPWTSEPDHKVFDYMIDGETLYTELVDLKLSDSQRGIFSKWKRPSEDNDGKFYTDPSVYMSGSGDIDLVQDISTDCSVVASLCAIVSRESKDHGQLMASLFYPQNRSDGSPRISINGKYIFRLQFNGCFRKVTVDDRLPISNTGRSLHVTDRNNQRLLWPALLEKAYLKTRGGYDFPGSNSGTDLWIILGWIPEQLFIQSDTFQAEKVWARVFKAFSYGDTIITLGTGEMTHIEEMEFGLVGKHNYAILDMKEVGSLRLFLIKNPWRDIRVWNGPKKKPLTPPNSHTKRSMGDLQDVLQKLPNPSAGSFWMNLESVAQHFEYLYLNWNPGLFRHRQDHHFDWVLPKVGNLDSFIHNPQYALRSSYKETVWILLSRHFSKEEQIINNSSQIEGESNRSSSLGFISLYILETKGQKVYLCDSILHRGSFVDSPQTIARIDVLPSLAYTVIITQQGMPLPKYSFTLSCFSRHPLLVDCAYDETPHRSSHRGVWNLHTAGGNASSTFYSTNPQYCISLSSTSDINLVLEANQQHLAVHVCMFWTGGVRVSTVTSKDIVGGSGDYRRGSALASFKNVVAGKYTIVCSTFEPGQRGNFTLYVSSTISCEVEQILSESTGRLSFKLEPLLFPEHIFKMIVPFTVTRFTRLKLIAKYKVIDQEKQPSNSRPLLKLSLERGEGSNKTILGVSGDGKFNNTPTGIRLEDINLNLDTNPGDRLWIVIERLGERQVLDIIDVEILSDSIVVPGAWSTDYG